LFHEAAAFAHTLVEGPQLFFVVGVVEAEHRHHVLDGWESLRRGSGDPLGGRIGCDEIRVVGLQPLELVQQPVEFLVGNLGRVMNVVPLFMMPDGVPQFFQPLFR
jgi:hypothetical protein